jgi:hypothetical protein
MNFPVKNNEGMCSFKDKEKNVCQNEGNNPLATKL